MSLTRLYSHWRTSKPVAALYHNPCPYMCCCPAAPTEHFRHFYLILSPYCSAQLGTSFIFWRDECGSPCSVVKECAALPELCFLLTVALPRRSMGKHFNTYFWQKNSRSTSTAVGAARKYNVGTSNLGCRSPAQS